MFLDQLSKGTVDQLSLMMRINKFIIGLKLRKGYGKYIPEL